MKKLLTKMPRSRLDAKAIANCIARCWSGTAGDARPAGACSTCRYTTSISQPFWKRRRGESDHTLRRLPRNLAWQRFQCGRLSGDKTVEYPPYRGNHPSSVGFGVASAPE